jgi:AbrB family looped-hinge helix DNA binding protein
VEVVTISPGFEVVIPLSVRERLHLRPGQQVQVIAYENRMEFIPLRPPVEMRGFLKGMSTDFERDAEWGKTGRPLGPSER